MKQGMFYLYAGLIGLLSGVTSGLFGVGGGIVMVPAMLFLLQVDVKTAIGTSLAIMVPSACMGTFKHYQLDHVYWRLAVSIIPLAIVGSFLGSWLTQYVPASGLKRAFGGLLVFIGMRLLLFR